MCTCEFCNIHFTPRPQVKNPRACKNCQIKRQRANEKAWREENRDPAGEAQYHRVHRQARLKQLQCLATYLSNCLSTGIRFLKFEGIKDLTAKDLFDWLFLFSKQLGIRRANKLWTSGKINFFDQLEAHLVNTNVQTSSSTC